MRGSGFKISTHTISNTLKGNILKAHIKYNFDCKHIVSFIITVGVNFSGFLLYFPSIHFFLFFKNFFEIPKDPMLGDKP